MGRIISKLRDYGKFAEPEIWYTFRPEGKTAVKIETPILLRLGPVPFWRGETKCLEGLQRIYRRAAALAEKRLGIGGRGGEAGAPGFRPKRASR